MDYKKLMDMTGKVCIVTGGTGYLGTCLLYTSPSPRD